jgi:HD superfamily phosphohydrolase
MAKRTATVTPLFAADLNSDARSSRRRNRKGSSKSQRQELFLPVNGFVWFYPEEMRVIDHPAFQRLSKINQLGQAYYVFRGATHKRMEHVLGAVGVAQRMISAVNFNSEKTELDQLDRPFSEQDWREGLGIEEERFVRLGALLHDIGHLAAGHTLEDELGLFGKHDEDDRLDYIFGDDEKLGRPEWEINTDVPTLAKLVDDLYGRYLPEDLDGRLSASRIVRLLIRKPPKKREDDRYKEEHDMLLGSSDLRANVCMNMIGNTICADLLDYIVRDWYHVGRVVQPEDRIFQYMEIRNEKASPPNTQFKGHRYHRHATDKFVLNLGSNAGRAPKIRTDGVSAILSLLERRYELGETVLYHKTKLSAGAMLGRALYELWADERQWKELLDRSDEQLIDYARACARAAQTLKLPEGAGDAERTKFQEKLESAKTAEAILLRLRSRHLYKAFYTERHWSLTGDQKEDLIAMFSPDGDDRAWGAANRTLAARLLEELFELSGGDIVVSCTNVKPKIAQVEVRVNGEIRKFNEYEQEQKRKRKPGLSGGHLTAQEKRFEDLWRLDFFMEARLYDRLKHDSTGVLELMKDAIEQVFVRRPADDPSLKRAAERIALAYQNLRIRKAARSDDAASAGYRAPDLSALWSQERPI